MKYNILFILSVFVGIAFFSSCEYETVQPEVIFRDPVDSTKVLSFATDVYPIFQSNCISCHNSGSMNFTSATAAFTTLQALINATIPKNSKIYTKFKNNEHPYKSLSASDLDLILQWIEKGGKNN
jgi:hypothetical protein